MAHLGPRDPTTGEVLRFEQIRTLLDKRDFGRVFLPLTQGKDTLAWRILLPDRKKLHQLLDAPVEVLQSHALDANAIDSFKRNDDAAFVTHRGALLDTWFRHFFTERSAPDESDRPPIMELVRRVDSQVARQ
jgi:hypothetical protein